MNAHRLGHYELQWMAGKFKYLPIKVLHFTPLVTAGTLVGAKMVFTTLALPDTSKWSVRNLDTVINFAITDSDIGSSYITPETFRGQIDRKDFKAFKKAARIEAAAQVNRFRRFVMENVVDINKLALPTF